jgi:hypothetical protein
MLLQINIQLERCMQICDKFPRTYISTDWLENIFPYLPIPPNDPEKIKLKLGQQEISLRSWDCKTYLLAVGTARHIS